LRKTLPGNARRGNFGNITAHESAAGFESRMAMFAASIADALTRVTSRGP
jgi:hypothetical protein